jgi:leader peptidase (prepilin peptidase)/N-methyltransferase
MIFIVLACVVGLFLGSFSTAIIAREMVDESWVFNKNNKSPSRSACPKCNHVLMPWDLVPLFSWIVSFGKCRYCQARISFFYPIIEILSAVFCGAIYSLFWQTPYFFPLIAALPFVMALFYVDTKRMILPDRLMICFLLCSVFFLIQQYKMSPDTLILYIGNGFLCSFSLWGMAFLTGKVLKKDALGFGDVKLAFVSGLWFLPQSVPYYFMISGGIGILYGAVLAKKNEGVFPFGPAMILAWVSILIFNQSF